jgi:hypothetical protein
MSRANSLTCCELAASNHKAVPEHGHTGRKALWDTDKLEAIHHHVFYRCDKLVQAHFMRGATLHSRPDWPRGEADKAHTWCSA